MLVIADEERAVAVAGVMGALNSEVKNDTTTVLFESANFDGASVRVTAKKLGLRTEASAKYEKGLDPHTTAEAVDRACELVELLGCGEVVGGMIDVCGTLPKPRTLKLRPEKINAFLGADIDTEYMISTLEKLELKVNRETMEVTIPTLRLDIESEADLAEEIVRIYGYNNIPSTLMSGVITTGGKNAEQKMEDKIKSILVAEGMYEIMTYSFTSPTIFDKLRIPADSDKRNVVVITNPLGEENSIMRTTTLSSMMEILARNYNQRNEDAKLFEIAKIYEPIEGEPLPKETNIVTIGAYGDGDFYALKSSVEELFDILGITDYKFRPETENPTFHGGRCASVYIGGKKAGHIGQAHPMVVKNYGMDCACYLAEISFDAIFENASAVKTYKKLPKYPAVSRDIAMLVDDEVLAGDIYDIIAKAGGKLLTDITLFDVYKGTQIPEGKKSMAYSVTLRAEDRTLTEEEINKVMGKILRSLEANAGAKLREN